MIMALTGLIPKPKDRGVEATTNTHYTSLRGLKRRLLPEEIFGVKRITTYGDK